MNLSILTDQTVQSLYAIGSGGLTGLGLGNSVEKQLWLPESTNDFIFSVVCEELGFVGAVLIIVLFVLFIVQGLWIAYRAENLYCTMVGIGIMAQIAWQVFCNIAVVTNTLPNTGIEYIFTLLLRRKRDIINIVAGAVMLGLIYFAMCFNGGTSFIGFEWYPYDLLHNLAHASGFVAGLVLGIVEQGTEWLCRARRTGAEQ